MTNGAHSRIGASSLHRWGTCPGSVAASQGMPRITSVHAAEGTVAHSVAEALLRREVYGELDDLPTVGAKHVVDGHEITVTQDMIDHCRVYVEAVAEIANQPGALTAIECRFDLSEIHPAMFGTADAVVLRGRKLWVFDLKYGQGIAVDAEDNEQLQYYAVGALLKTGAKVDEVEIVIGQPRAPHELGPIRRWTISTLALFDFASGLRIKAEATEQPNAPRVPGDHCQFCAFAPLCPELRADVQAVAESSFDPPDVKGVPQYDPAELTRRLRDIPKLRAYIKRLEEFAYFETVQGRGSPEFKLVEKRAVREWRDDQQAQLWLQLEFGLEEDSILGERPLRTPAQLEKLIPAKYRREMDRLTRKQSNGVTLVPIEDRRVAVRRDAASEFNAVAQTSTE